MRLFRKYSTIKGLMDRFTIIKIGKLHIRYHKIFGKDETELFHSHPFNYISIILSGGYTDLSIQVDNSIKKEVLKALSTVKRKHSTQHRLEDILPNTKTLFITWGNFGWQAFNPNQKQDFSIEMVKTKNGWYKKCNGIIYIDNEDYYAAKNETRHSIHQHRT